MAELPARKEEVEHAEEEGIIFKTLCNPVEIHANDEGFVKSITCIEMELGEPTLGAPSIETRQRVHAGCGYRDR